MQWKNITTNNPEDDIIMYNNILGDGAFFIVTPGVYVLEYTVRCCPRSIAIFTSMPGAINGKPTYYSFKIQKGEVLDIGAFAINTTPVRTINNQRGAKSLIPGIKKSISIIDAMPGENVNNKAAYKMEEASFFYNPYTLPRKLKREGREIK